MVYENMKGCCRRTANSPCIEDRKNSDRRIPPSAVNPCALDRDSGDARKRRPPESRSADQSGRIPRRAIEP
jgi:hypothetical protein